MMENRLVVRLKNYWERIKKDSPMPDFKKNNPAMIEDLWSQCFVLAVLPPVGSNYKYDFLGDKVKDVYRRDLTGSTVDLQGSQFPNSIVSKHLKEVGESAFSLNQPLEDEGQTPSVGGKFIKYRIVMLPFGGDKQGVTHILVGLSFREF